MENLIEIEASRANSGALTAWKQRDAVTNGQSAETAREMTLDELAKEIREEANKGDERLLNAAMLLRELKHRIEAGEAGVGVKWTEWARDKFGRKKTWIRNLDLIASAKDPIAELERIRKDGCERQRKYRQSHVEYDPVRREVMKMLRSLNSNQVRNVHQYIWRTILN
jgi:hypothetical protein